MTHGDWLQTLAEIGLGFAGFVFAMDDGAAEDRD